MKLKSSFSKFKSNVQKPSWWGARGLEILLFVAAFWAVNWWQTKDMLDTSTKIPSFTMVSLEGTKVDESLFEGKKTLVYFFAPWCSICNASASNLNDLVENLSEKKQVIVIGLDYSSADEIRSFATKHDLQMPVYIGNETIKQGFKIEAYPSYYIINTDGKIINSQVGYSTATGMKLRL